MPVAGRKPKKDGPLTPNKAPSRQPRHEWVEILDEPFAGNVPSLPRRRGGWPARAKQKWAVWSSMPHCVMWSEADWQFALDSLEVAAQFHEGNVRLGTELRNREKVLGTTVDFRRDLRIRYVDPMTEEKPAADVPNLNDYRDRA